MNIAGENSAVGQSIPVPTVRTRNYAWARTVWSTQATVWPPRPSRLAPLTVATHLLFALFLIAAFAGIGLLLAEYLTVADGDAIRQSVLAVILAETVLAFSAVLLRRIGIAPSVSRLLLVVFVPSAVGFLVLGTFVAQTTSDTAGYVIIPQVANVPLLISLGIFIVLTMAVSSLLKRQVSEFAHWRSMVQAARKTAFPNGQRTRRFSSEPAVIGPSSGELERRLAIAEQLTDPLLEQLLVMPGVTIVKGVEFPGERMVHIGHALIAGNHVALIDSVLWEPGEYFMDAWGRVVRDHKIDENINVMTATAAQRYAADRPQLTVRSWAVVHCLTDAPIAVDAHPQSEVRLVTPEDLVSEVGDWLAPVGDTIDLFALQFAVNARLK